MPGKPLTLFVFILLGFSPALSGIFFVPGEWYQGLIKPQWTPPAWLFPPVWTLLYLTIGIAGYLAWQRSEPQSRRWPFTFYGLQLVLNGLWSWIFFGLHKPGLALAELTALWIAIVGTIAGFYRLHRVAAALLIPYLLWVTFAGVLNWAIVDLN